MRTRVKQTRDPLRRRAILEAALSAFTELGYASTTLSVICQRSGASVGSVYHFFSGKEEIAFELIRDAIEGWGKESGERALDPQDAESAVRASVRGLLQWGDRNDALFRFMEEMRARAGSNPELPSVEELFSEGRKRAEALYATWVERRMVRDLSWPVAYALMVGPAYHYLRTKPTGDRIAAEDIERLASAAWEAVRETK